MTDNELIAEFMGYKFHEVADIDDSDCGGLYTRKDIYSKIPILMNKYPEDDQFYLSDEWVVPDVDTYIEGPLRYDTSWNWLMPVVAKCLTYPPITKWRKSERFEYYLSVADFRNIKIVYAAVVEFVKWCNEPLKVNDNS
jgi:hypothetical protein